MENNNNSQKAIKVDNPNFLPIELQKHLMDSLDEEKKLSLEVLKKYKLDPSEPIIEPDPILVLTILGQEYILGTKGNFSVISGKAKSRKSFLLVLLSSAILNGHQESQIRGSQKQAKVAFFDTEMGKHHVQKNLKRISEAAGHENINNLDIYYLRELNPSERLAAIGTYLEEHKDLDVLIIDGVRDLVSSINDEEQATDISSILMKWSSEYDIHIILVLHQNKGDNNLRGHLGTELTNKAETVLSVTKETNESEVSTVSAEYCRNMEPPDFHFRVTNNLPALDGNYVPPSPNKREDLADIDIDTTYNILHKVFKEQEAITYLELVNKIKLHARNVTGNRYGVNKVKEFITALKEEGILFQEKSRGPHYLKPKPLPLPSLASIENSSTPF